jgi:hypothetical protein
MSIMSDLHLLSGRVLDGETVESVASDSTYSKKNVARATANRLRIDAGMEQQWN